MSVQTKSKKSRSVKSRPAKSHSAVPRPKIDLVNDCLLSRKQTSKVTGLAMNTLRQMAMERRGPRFLKFGTSQQARVAYRRSDVEAWLASRFTEHAGSIASHE